jgi:hypothetical protein
MYFTERKWHKNITKENIRITHNTHVNDGFDPLKLYTLLQTYDQGARQV